MGVDVHYYHPDVSFNHPPVPNLFLVNTYYTVICLPTRKQCTVPIFSIYIFHKWSFAGTIHFKLELSALTRINSMSVHLSLLHFNSALLARYWVLSYPSLFVHFPNNTFVCRSFGPQIPLVSFQTQVMYSYSLKSMCTVFPRIHGLSVPTSLSWDSEYSMRINRENLTQHIGKYIHFHCIQTLQIKQWTVCISLTSPAVNLTVAKGGI